MVSIGPGIICFGLSGSLRGIRNTEQERPIGVEPVRPDRTPGTQSDLCRPDWTQDVLNCCQWFGYWKVTGGQGEWYYVEGLSGRHIKEAIHSMGLLAGL